MVIPDALTGRVVVADGRLRVRGTLTTAQRGALLAADADGGYQTAVNAVYDAPRAALSRYLKVWQWPPLSAPLAAIPATVQIPPELRTRLYFDPSTQRFVVNGPLAQQESIRLIALSADAAWVAAIGALDAAVDGYAPTATEQLFTAAEVTALLDTDASARIITVAGGFAGHLRTQLSQRAVVTAFAEQLGLPLALVDEMLTRRLTSLVAAGQPAITDFLDAGFASGHPDITLTAAGFERQFLSYMRLFKLGRLVERLRWSSAELGWLADYGSTVADRPVPWQPALNAPWWLPDSLPVTTIARSAERLAALLRVVRLGRSAAKLGRPVVDTLLSLAREAGTTLADLTKVLAAATSRNGVQISDTDLTALATTRGLVVADFADETAMWAQLPAIELIRRTGASAAQLLEFAAPECDDHAARSAREVVKARYDDAQWRAVAGPLRDVLRGAQRDALLNYVLADPKSKWPALQVESELYRHLLLDSRTEPMVGTSRIKQASLNLTGALRNPFMAVIVSLGGKGFRVGQLPPTRESIWASLSLTPARLTWSPSTSPSQP